MKVTCQQCGWTGEDSQLPDDSSACPNCPATITIPPALVFKVTFADGREITGSSLYRIGLDILDKHPKAEFWHSGHEFCENTVLEAGDEIDVVEPLSDLTAPKPESGPYMAQVPIASILVVPASNPTFADVPLAPNPFHHASDAPPSGCAKMSFVIGTNGGKLPCGSPLKWLDGKIEIIYCDECKKSRAVLSKVGGAL